MKKRLMIDMDDVITIGTFKEQIEDFIGHPIDTEKTGYFLQNALEDRKEEFFHKGPLDMYEDAPLLDNAYEVIKELNEKYEVYLVSSYVIPDAHYQEGNHLKYKMEYLQKRLPFIKTEQIIFSNIKTIMNFDIAIDDSIRHLENAKMKIMFNAFHNGNISDEELKEKGIIKVNNWLEIKKLLLED